MLTFHKNYHPLTSRPFLSDQSYMEYQPSELLQPYIACYWMSHPASREQRTAEEVLVIPDTCVDIMVQVNHTRQRITCSLCGIQDEPFVAVQEKSDDIVTGFAIRFYFWAAHLFIKLNFSETRNKCVEAEALGREWEKLFEPFLYLVTMEERIAWAESFLLKKVNEMESNVDLFNAVHQIMQTSGRVSVKEICAYSCLSQRQMERLFQKQVGLPLKRMVNLVRYQNVWREIAACGRFDVQDAVHRYGYTDQAHLLKEFKRFHGISPEEARKIAKQRSGRHCNWRNSSDRSELLLIGRYHSYQA